MAELSSIFNDLRILLPDGTLKKLPPPAADGKLYLPLQHVILDGKPADASEFKIEHQPDGSILITAKNGEKLPVYTEQLAYRDDLPPIKRTPAIRKSCA